jgi:radical SAM protein with 4Fe4S-binding SPASM domain
MNRPLEELFVEVTNRCLQGCIHCSSCAVAETATAIPLAQLCSLIDEATELGLKSFTISGGEPFLYPHLDQLISYIHSKNIDFSIYTCGVVHNTDGQLSCLSDKQLEYVASMSPRSVIFSLHGASGEVHEFISKVPGSFSLTLESIRKAIRIGLNVELHFVPMQINIYDIRSLVHLAKSIGISRVSLLRLVVQGRCTPDLAISKQDGEHIKSIVDELRNELHDVTVRLGSPFNCITLPGKSCTVAQNKLLISANGEVFPCEAFKFLRGSRSTIYTSTIEDIWNNDALLNRLRDLETSTIHGCSSCEYYNACRGGCPGERLLFNGDINIGPEPWCLYSEC